MSMLRALCLLCLAACAGNPRITAATAPIPAAPLAAAPRAAALEREELPGPLPVEPAVPEEPVAIGSEYEENQGGSWVPPELGALLASLEGSAARPTRVSWVGGSAASCEELWRFRLVYGSYERFANVSGFRSADAAAACGDEITARFGDGPGNVHHAAGALLVVLNRNVTAAQRDGLIAALDALSVEAASPVPPRALPAGASPGLYQRERQRPPPQLRRAGR